MDAKTFKRFAQEEYQLSHWASIQRDGARINPKVTAAAIFKSIVYQPVLGARSLLELDQLSRFPVLKELVGSPREMVSSDTTALNALALWEMGPARLANYAWHLKIRQQGLAATWLSTGRRVHLGIVDGSDLGGHLFSVLAFAGAIYHGVDAERSPGRGHELATSRNLLLRAKDYLGEGFASHILYDGLMADRIDLAFVREQLNSHLVVKTSDETLNIIADTKEAWMSLATQDLKRVGVERVNGTDSQRMVVYEAWAQSGIPWEGLNYPLNLAWVRETHLKGKYVGETFGFWVITTDETLTALEMREMAHDRWAIENNGFKETSQRVGSKNSYIKNADVKETLLLMWLAGMTLLKAFRLSLECTSEWRQWGARKTKNLVAKIIEFGIPREVLARGASP